MRYRSYGPRVASLTGHLHYTTPTNSHPRPFLYLLHSQTYPVHHANRKLFLQERQNRSHRPTASNRQLPHLLTLYPKTQPSNTEYRVSATAKTAANSQAQPSP